MQGKSPPETRGRNIFLKREREKKSFILALIFLLIGGPGQSVISPALAGSVAFRGESDSFG